MAKKPKDDAALPLDQARTVTLKAAGRELVYHLRRVTAADWLKYFQGIVHQTVQRGRERDEVYEADTALMELVNSVIEKVEGYGDLAAVKDWKQALPIKHRIAVGMALRSVGRSSGKEMAPSLCDLVEVKLDATWPAGGKMVLYSGLVHRFRQPEIADLKRFNFEASRVKVMGTAMDGISVYPSKQAIAMKLYDDLVESVEGYTLAGKPIDGIDAIKREMDGAHKAAAALQLFVGDDEVTIV